MDEIVSKIAFILYAIAFVIGLWEYVTKRKMKFVIYFFCLAVGVNLLALIIRAVIAQHLPFASRYEAIMMYVFSTAFVALILSILFRYKLLILSIIPLLLVFLIIALTAQKRAPMPLPPVLSTPLFCIHVILAFLGYAFYTTNFSLSFFIKSEQNKVIRIVDRSAALGSLFLGAGIAMGAVWAALSWGDWWAWDPKETWALITFLIYILFLHTRRVFKLNRLMVTIFIVAGYASLVMTFLGISLLMSIHSY